MRMWQYALRSWAGIALCAMLDGCTSTQMQRPAQSPNHAEVEPFIQAAGKGDFPAVSSALQQGINVNAQDATGATAIQKASRYNKHQMVDYLIKNGADVNLADQQGYDAIFIASAFGQDDVIRILAASKAEFNAVNEKGLFPLLLAVNGDYASTIRLLVLSGARPNLTNTNGTSALLFACEKNSKDAVSVLLELGADPDLADTGGWTPLMVAVQKGCTSVVENLIQNGVDVSLENRDGMSALLLAIECDQLELARLLMKNHAKYTMDERYPYLAGISCYLGARQLNDKETAGDLKALYAAAARLFDMAAKEYEAAIKDNSASISGRNIRSALFIASSAVLLVATGGAPIPCALTNERLREAIKMNKIRLDRCNQMKAQCENAVARLDLTDANRYPTDFSQEDLTLTFCR